ncbi:MAG: hypothetical protein GXP01_03295 [Alphaproteobacteria bacterium]|nr:hypothetical protein [Alphaproteobacteria bacterium]
MIWLVLGIIVFFGVHTVRMVAPRFRENMISRLGDMGWKGLYAAISLAGFVVMIWGYGLAHAGAPVLYNPGIGMKYVAISLVFFGFLIFGSAYLPANRIKAAFRHPFNIGLFFIALGHVIANGNLATVLLAGATAVYLALNTLSALSPIRLWPDRSWWMCWPWRLGCCYSGCLPLACTCGCSALIRWPQFPYSHGLANTLDGAAPQRQIAFSALHPYGATATVHHE